jgi:hypothetical protein
MKSVFGLICLLLMASCSSSSPFHANKIYSEKPLSKKAPFLITSIDQSRIYVRNGDDVIDDYKIPTDSIDIILQQRLAAHLKAKSNRFTQAVTIHKESFKPIIELRSDQYFSRNFKVKERYKEDSTFYHYKIPKKSIIDSVYGNVRYLLFFQKLNFQRKQQAPQAGLPYGGGISITLPDGQLIANFAFMIWDYQLDDFVLFGDTNYYESFSLYILKRSNWENAIGGIVSEIYKQSPFTD